MKLLLFFFIFALVVPAYFHFTEKPEECKHEWDSHKRIGWHNVEILCQKCGRKM